MTDTTYPGVSVVVLNWNGKALLAECLPSVVEAAQSYSALGPCEVIVSDNGSTDGSISLLKEQFPTVKLVELGTNTGFQTGCNRGVDASQYDYIVLLNNDVAVEKDFIEPLISHLANNQAFSVGPKMFFWDRQYVFCGAIRGEFQRGNFVQKWALDNNLQDICARVAPTIYLSGGAMAFNKHMFNALGQFDLLFYPIYWEDTDICYRAWKRGWRSLYEPRSVVYHKVSATMSHHKLSHHTFMQRNGYLFMWRNITDYDILFQHLLWLPVNILAASRNAARIFKTSYLSALRLELKSFFAALKRLPQVRHRRKLDKLVQLLSDKEVIAQSDWREYEETAIFPVVPDIDCLAYQCNICGQLCKSKLTEIGRETPSCPRCQSTVRMRAIIHLLSLELFGESLPLPDFPVRKDIRGIGLSDWEVYGDQLARKLNYTNTYYHQDPRLDITNIDPALEGTLDFLISTDVFEHIAPPVSAGFQNAYKLLKPGGVLIFSVPYIKAEQTLEHFPDLYEYEIVNTDGNYMLKNLTRDGQEQVFENLVFHGGIGSTLEMRLFAETALMDELTRVGFQQVKISKDHYFKYGIYWHQDWSLPITARKPD